MKTVTIIKALNGAFFIAWMAAALESCAGLRVGWANSVEGAMEILEDKNEKP